MEIVTSDRRLADRRVRRLSLHYPERRRGFDRRLPGGSFRAACARMVRTYRDRPLLIASVLSTVVLLNALDLALTMRAIHLGAVELNPVMAALLGLDPALAAACKLTLVGIVAAVLWILRGYRRVLEASLLLLIGFTLLFGYQLAVLAAA